MMKAIGIAGYKKSGKTTLLLKLAEELTNKGYQVAAIKHISEDIDDEADSDTTKYKKYLSQVAAISTKESVIHWKGKSNLEEILKFLDADIILIEGFKNEKTFPKIVCLRKESEKTELF
ncbi:MAG: molybdopterin-guanine dinucleotide biosynthesis protein B, partial [Candidatus Atribacteria bacterium]|nr:molybdopterin-guanine dinucleotide biosynthesis protein B [Candidatus Atribacteria bacterium]